MARSSGASVSSALERIFDSSDSEEVYRPSTEDEEESEGSEISESPATSVDIEGGGAAISDSGSGDKEPPKKKTRKRLKAAETWQKNKRKRKRNSGKKYTSTVGSLVSVFLHTLSMRCWLLASSVSPCEQVPPKRSDRTSCGCARHCFDKVSQERRKALFEGFWKMANFDIQNTYLCGCIKTSNTKRKYTKREESRRKFTRVFYVSNGGISERVCKTAFLSIFSVSNGCLSRALQGQAECGGLPHCDQRGRHEPANKTQEERVAFVKAHIDRFPKYESHYSRSDNPNRNYLSPSLSVSTMYDLYKSACAEENETPVSEWKYRHIFNTEYNLSFGRYFFVGIIRTELCVCALYV